MFLNARLLWGFFYQFACNPLDFMSDTICRYWLTTISSRCDLPFANDQKLCAWTVSLFCSATPNMMWFSRCNFVTSPCFHLTIMVHQYLLSRSSPSRASNFALHLACIEIAFSPRKASAEIYTKISLTKRVNGLVLLIIERYPYTSMR